MHMSVSESDILTECDYTEALDRAISPGPFASEASEGKEGQVSEKKPGGPMEELLAEGSTEIPGITAGIKTLYSH